MQFFWGVFVFCLCAFQPVCIASNVDYEVLAMGSERSPSKVLYYQTFDHAPEAKTLQIQLGPENKAGLPPADKAKDDPELTAAIIIQSFKRLTGSPSAEMSPPIPQEGKGMSGNVVTDPDYARFMGEIDGLILDGRPCNDCGLFLALDIPAGGIAMFPVFRSCYVIGVSAFSKISLEGWQVGVRFLAIPPALAMIGQFSRFIGLLIPNDRYHPTATHFFPVSPTHKLAKCWVGLMSGVNGLTQVGEIISLEPSAAWHVAYGLIAAADAGMTYDNCVEQLERDFNRVVYPQDPLTNLRKEMLLHKINRDKKDIWRDIDAKVSGTGKKRWMFSTLMGTDDFSRFDPMNPDMFRPLTHMQRVRILMSTGVTMWAGALGRYEIANWALRFIFLAMGIPAPVAEGVSFAASAPYAMTKLYGERWLHFDSNRDNFFGLLPRSTTVSAVGVSSKGSALVVATMTFFKGLKACADYAAPARVIVSAAAAILDFSAYTTGFRRFYSFGDRSVVSSLVIRTRGMIARLNDTATRRLHEIFVVNNL